MSRTEDNRGQPELGYDWSPDFSIDALPDAIVIADAETGQIVDANAAAGELFHCRPAELIGRHQSELHPPGELDEYAKAFRRGIESERVNRLQNGDPLYIKTADGDHKPVEINARQHTADGRAVIIGVFREISEQLDRQQQLEATTTRLETLLDALPLPVAVLALDGTVERWNQAAEETFGYTAEAIVGEQRSLFLDDEELGELLDQLQDETVFTGYETVLRGCGGQRIPVELYVHPLYDGDTISGVIGVAVDISDQQRRVEQLSILHRMLRHNIRNQLGVIRGWAKQFTVSGSQGTDAAARIIAASRDLLEMSEEAKQIQADLTVETPTDPVEIETVVAALHELASGEPPTVAVRSSVSPETVTVPAYAERVVRTLGETVLKQVGEERLEVRVDPQDRYVTVELAAPMSLLPEGERGLIEHGQETALNHGNGLDIAHAHLLVRSIGGDISLDDRDSSASVLHLELPREDPNTRSK